MPLDPGTRAAMEPLFGRDLGRIRVHTDAKAADSAKAVNAAAYTVGQNVVFGAGRYAPGTDSGKKLLTHELTHTIQHGDSEGTPQPLRLDGPGTDPLEREAESVSNQVDRGVSSIRPDSPFLESTLRSETEGALSSLPASTHGLPSVVSQRATTGGAGTLQRKIVPEDVSDQLIGRDFKVTQPFTAGSIKLTGGETVEVVAWDNQKPTVQVQLPAPYINRHIPFDIPKTILRPTGSGQAGVAPYTPDVAGASAAVTQGEQDIASWKAQESQYQKNIQLFKKELSRLEGLQKTREGVLNRRLIQGSMYNRFDGLIVAAIKEFGAKIPIKDALSPDLVKAQLFEESELGTAGEHLVKSGTSPVKSVFNLGQVIDSSGLALLTMMAEDQPALITTYNLQDLRADLKKSQSEFAKLKKKAEGGKALSATETAELSRLTPLAKQNWEVYIWNYKATGQTTGYADAAQAFLTGTRPGLPARSLDYEFWIRAAVRWLFEKRTHTSSWEEAIRAYNGSGTRANHYRDAIKGRADAAQAAQKGNVDFVPTH